jgi:hypothetical protein
VGNYTLQVDIPADICKLLITMFCLIQILSKNSYFHLLHGIYTDEIISRKKRRVPSSWCRTPSILYKDEKAFRRSIGSHLTQNDCLIVIFEMLVATNAKSQVVR